MWPVFNLVADNLGVSFEVGVVLLILLGGIIFYAVDFRKGSLFSLMSSACLFVWFYLADLQYSIPLVLFFINVIILSFTLLAIEKTGTSGGGMI